MNPVFARITKVDEERREVTGRATQEMVDRDNEILDYATSKPEFMKWSAEVFADSGGKSLGNVRSMHGNTAAGKLTDIQFNDVEKAIDVTAKIVDDNEWKKCLEGVHTGFSIGGSYIKKWAEAVNGKMVQRYTARPSEISIVDRPCVSAAKFFNIHKRDGSVVRQAFVEHEIEDGLEKGGPGSGPHGGSGQHENRKREARTVAEKANKMAIERAGNASRGNAEAGRKASSMAAASTAMANSRDTSESHLRAAEYHMNAALTQSKTGSTAGTKIARMHESAADHHYAMSQATKSESTEFGKIEFINGKIQLAKGGPGSGPHPGTGKAKSRGQGREHAQVAHAALLAQGYKEDKGAREATQSSKGTGIGGTTTDTRTYVHQDDPNKTATMTHTQHSIGGGHVGVSFSG